MSDDPSLAESLRAETSADELKKHYASGGRNFARAKLAGANLAGYNLSSARLDNANLENANLNKTNLSGTSLAAVKGLTAEQVKSALTDSATQLPESLNLSRRGESK